METQNEVTELTEEEKEAVRENWRKLAAVWKTTGVEFFLRLFKTYPVTKTFFKTFKDMDIEDIRKEPKIRAHAINFKHGITSFVESLDDMECLIVLIQKLTVNHFRRQIKVEQFQDAFALFIEVAKETIEVNEFTVNAWKKALKIIAGVIAQHMKTLQEQTDGE